MRQPKQKRGLMRRATITLAAIAAGALPMLTPQWMTSVAAYGYGYGVYDLSKKTLSFSEVIIPYLDRFSSGGVVNRGVFEAKLQDLGDLNFVLIPSSIKPAANFTPPGSFTSGQVIYDHTTGKLKSPYVSVQTKMEIGGFTYEGPEVWYKDVELEPPTTGTPDVLEFTVTNATPTPSGP
ncbi:MAG: hypothetical protein DRR19_27435 [Candidatus Parabeggiatoa sp. nov. 1]|nr:MAG: hypothetical protein DRR19_27435 [Gammaproteobacteria bacterium]